MTILSA